MAMAKRRCANRLEFDVEILHCMGPEFYEQVFRPAIEQARPEKKSYEAIRDSIRADWKPAKRKR